MAKESAARRTIRTKSFQIQLESKVHQATQNAWIQVGVQSREQSTEISYETGYQLVNDRDGFFKTGRVRTTC